jgi:hypothetical protein
MTEVSYEFRRAPAVFDVGRAKKKARLGGAP